VPGSGASGLAGVPGASADGTAAWFAESSFNDWSRCIIALMTESETPSPLRQMISSTPGLKGLIELLTNAIITLWSTPAFASLSSSETGPASLILGGRGCPVELGPTVASALAPGWSAPAAFAARLDASRWIAPANSNVATANPTPQLQRIQAFMCRYARLNVIASSAIPI
jgi:hypothetical protein